MFLPNLVGQAMTDEFCGWNVRNHISLHYFALGTLCVWLVLYKANIDERKIYLIRETKKMQIKVKKNYKNKYVSKTILK